MSKVSELIAAVRDDVRNHRTISALVHLDALEAALAEDAGRGPQGFYEWWDAKGNAIAGKNGMCHTAHAAWNAATALAASEKPPL